MIVVKVAFGNCNEAFIENRLRLGVNIIHSNENNRGKTVFVQAMLYAIGNNPVFPATFDYKKYYYYVEFISNGKIYEICRNNDYFVVKSNYGIYFFNGVKELKEFYRDNVFMLPQIIKNGIKFSIDPELYIQLFFVGQDINSTDNIACKGLYNKNDFYEMLYSMKNCNASADGDFLRKRMKSDIDELVNKNKVLYESVKFFKEKNNAISYLSKKRDEEDWEELCKEVDGLRQMLLNLRKERKSLLTRKLKWTDLLSELNSINRKIKSSKFVCGDCGSQNIIFSLSDNLSFPFSVTTGDDRKIIKNSIESKITLLNNKMTEINNEIEDKMNQFKSIIKEQDISLEDVVYCKKMYFEGENAETMIVKNDEEIERIKNEIKLMTEEERRNDENRAKMMDDILHKMNDVYKQIDPKGSLKFSDIFTKRNQVYSGSEATIFNISKLIAFYKEFEHNCPIVIDSFRAEELSTEKERVVLNLLHENVAQSIITATTKVEEKDKYNKIKHINSIDYSKNKPNKILCSASAEEFIELLEEVGINIINNVKTIG